MFNFFLLWQWLYMKQKGRCICGKLLWGGIAGSASLIGAAVLMLVPVKKRIIGFIMALGTGALIGSTSYELLEEAYEISGGLQEEAIGFLGGAVIFTILDIVISRSGGKNRKSSSLHKTHNKDEKGYED